MLWSLIDQARIAYKYQDKPEVYCREVCVERHSNTSYINVEPKDLADTYGSCVLTERASKGVDIRRITSYQ